VLVDEAQINRIVTVLIEAQDTHRLSKKLRVLRKLLGAAASTTQEVLSAMVLTENCKIS
jgi:hypothetical protein